MHRISKIYTAVESGATWHGNLTEQKFSIFSSGWKADCCGVVQLQSVSLVWVEPWVQYLVPQKPSFVVQAYNPSIQEGKAGWSGFKIIFSYIANSSLSGLHDNNKDKQKRKTSWRDVSGTGYYWNSTSVIFIYRETFSLSRKKEAGVLDTLEHLRMNFLEIFRPLDFQSSNPHSLHPH